MIEVDARGLSCPLPVIRVKEAIEANPGEEIRVLIDAMVTVENVTRMAHNMGLAVDEPIEEGDDIILNLRAI